MFTGAGNSCSGRSSLSPFINNQIIQHIPGAVFLFLLLFNIPRLLLRSHRGVIDFVFASIRTRNFKNADPGSRGSRRFFRLLIRGGRLSCAFLCLLGKSFPPEEGQKDPSQKGEGPKRWFSHEGQRMRNEILSFEQFSFRATCFREFQETYSPRLNFSTSTAASTPISLRILFRGSFAGSFSAS